MKFGGFKIGGVPKSVASAAKSAAPRLGAFGIEKDQKRPDPRALLHGSPKRRRILQEEDDDPLAAFMAGLETQQKKEDEQKRQENSGITLISADGWENDALADAMEKKALEGQKKINKDFVGPSARPEMMEKTMTMEKDNDDKMDLFDSNYPPEDRRKMRIDAMDLKVNHQQLFEDGTYGNFRKNFYKEHSTIKEMSEEQTIEMRKNLEVSVNGTDIPKPCYSFSQLNLPEFAMDVLIRNDYQEPTPIQAQACPCILQGRDLIGTAQTGSGKTLAFVLPMLVHVANQEPLQKNEGPLALILCPTQDLAIQIEKEIFKFGKKIASENYSTSNNKFINTKLRSVTLAGGLSKHEQWKACKAGCEIVVGSPGRVMDLIKEKAISLTRITYLVLDEADRMLDLGFEPQVISIVKNTRPDRQTLLFSATFPPKIEMLAREYLTKPLKVMVGQTGQSAVTVEQKVKIFYTDNKDDTKKSGGNKTSTAAGQDHANGGGKVIESEIDIYKFQWLEKNLDTIMSDGQVLIFCRSKDRTELVLKKIFDMHLKCFEDSSVSGCTTPFGIGGGSFAYGQKGGLPNIINNVGGGNAKKIAVLHGDLEQYERLDIIGKYRQEKIKLLIATDVAARGLDIAGIRTVVNFDAAARPETHTHRIGRTGRAGKKGVAWTLLEKKDSKIASHIIEGMEKRWKHLQDESGEIHGEPKPSFWDNLWQVAMQNPTFAMNRKNKGGSAQQKPNDVVRSAVGQQTQKSTARTHPLPAQPTFSGNERTSTNPNTSNDITSVNNSLGSPGQKVLSSLTSGDQSRAYSLLDQNEHQLRSQKGKGKNSMKGGLGIIPSMPVPQGASGDSLSGRKNAGFLGIQTQNAGNITDPNQIVKKSASGVTVVQNKNAINDDDSDSDDYMAPGVTQRFGIIGKGKK